MNIKGSIEKVPGGMMVVPLITGALVNTFFPKALSIGGFTTALFKNGAMPLIALEHGRKTISSKDRPSIDAVENETMNGAGKAEPMKAAA